MLLTRQRRTGPVESRSAGSTKGTHGVRQEPTGACSDDVPVAVGSHGRREGVPRLEWQGPGGIQVRSLASAKRSHAVTLVREPGLEGRVALPGGEIRVTDKRAGARGAASYVGRAPGPKTYHHGRRVSALRLRPTAPTGSSSAVSSGARPARRKSGTAGGLGS
jgi:hypothetical protein